MTSRALLLGVTSEVLDHRRARHQPRDARRTNGQRESHGAQEGVIPMERLSWRRAEERSTAKQLACEP